MKLDEVINQLEDIQDHCKSMIDKDDPEGPWQKDVEALDYAIKVLKGKSRFKRFLDKISPYCRQAKIGTKKNIY